MEEEKNSASQSTSQTQQYVSIAVVVLVVIGLLFFLPRPAPKTDITVNEPSVVILAEVSSEDVVLGDPNAPVTVIEFGDFQCPFCESFHSGALSSIRNEYIRVGLVRFIYRDFPLDRIHPYARAASEAAHCAGDQGKYWEYHDYLFEHQAQIPAMDFVEVAQLLKIDVTQFRACVESRKYRERVERNLQDGITAGVRGTPATFVNGVLVTIDGQNAGGAPYPVFKSAIENALQALLENKN